MGRDVDWLAAQRVFGGIFAEFFFFSSRSSCYIVTTVISNHGVCACVCAFQVVANIIGYVIPFYSETGHTCTKTARSKVS